MRGMSTDLQFITPLSYVLLVITKILYYLKDAISCCKCGGHRQSRDIKGL